MTPEKILWYLRQKWTDEHDCYYWFKKIQKEEFGRDCPVLCIEQSVSTLSLKYIVKILSNPLEVDPRWRRLEEGEAPQVGDGALLAIKVRPHHIGVVVEAGARVKVLHALDKSGMRISDHVDLMANGWQLKGYLRYAEI
jgi:hypothetical protein